MNINVLRAAVAASSLPHVHTKLSPPPPADALAWCLDQYSGGTCPHDGRNNWLTGLALFCNERGVAEAELLEWAAGHGPLHGHKKIAATIKGNYERKRADHNSLPYTSLLAGRGNAAVTTPVAWLPPPT